MAAAAVKSPELMLDKTEADGLAKALVAVEKQFPTQVDPKVLALGNLLFVAGMIYLPRAGAISMRLKREREQARPKGPLEGVRRGVGDVTTAGPSGIGGVSFTSQPEETFATFQHPPQ